MSGVLQFGGSIVRHAGMLGSMSIDAFRPIHEGWSKHQAMVIDSVRGLTRFAA
jgi:hypothetical protein